jgi:lipopolysaccharide transport system permease protein
MGTAEAQIDPGQHELVITPPKGWSSLQLRELWDHRELIYFLTKRELQIRYKQSIFGASWAVLQPLAYTFVLAIVFGTLVKLPTEGFPYAVFAIVGIVPWMFTAGAIQTGASSLVQDANLITKVYFPRLALPISKGLSLAVDLAVSFPIVVLLILVYGVTLQATFPLVVLFLGLGVITAFAIGMFFAAVNVRYRDVAQIVPVFVQMMFFATPIIYSTAAFNVTDRWLYILSINPMFSAIEGARWAMIGTEYPGTGRIAISCAVALLVLFFGLRYFQKTEQTFADYV